MYQDPLKVATRKVNDNLVVMSCPCRVRGRYDLGGRMMAISYDHKNILLYSALPYAEAVKSGLELLTGTKDYVITHIIVPNVEHNLMAKSYKTHFPSIKLVGTDKLDFTDVKLTNEMANKVISGQKFDQLGIEDKNIRDNVELIYLSYHKNKEAVLYEKTSKSLFLCDSFINISTGPLESYSPEIGYDKDYTPLTGFSYMLRWFNPSTWIFKNVLCARINSLSKPEAMEALKLVSAWDFTRIEVVHGNPVDENAKEKFKSLFDIE